MFEDARSHNRRLALAPLTLAIALFTLPASAAEDECDVKSIANMVKAISILRSIENSINFLALAQTNAIIAVGNGIPVHPTNETDHSFYGPIMILRKDTDKTETYLHDLDKSIHRLSMFNAIERNYTSIDQNAETIVSAGYDVLKKLEASDVTGAIKIYASTTVPALFDARGDTYTTMSNFERIIAKAGGRCK
jgi:hypothetical protein